MNFFLIILFYTFVSSILFVYGIGLEHIYIHIENPKKTFSFLIKNITHIFLSITFLWFLSYYVLNPLSLNFLLPVLTVFFLEFFNFIFTLILPKYYVLEHEEKVFSWGLAFFCLYQAATYKECLAMIFAGILSLFVFLFILHAIKQRVENNENFSEWQKAALLLISLGLILSAFYLTDISPFFLIVND